MTEAQGLDHVDDVFRLGQLFADQILAGDAEMGAPRTQGPGDLAGGQERNFHIGDAGHAADIAAGRACLLDGTAGLLEEGKRVLLQASLGGDSDDQPVFRVLTGHERASRPTAARSRSVRMAQPTAGTLRGLPRLLSRPS